MGRRAKVDLTNKTVRATLPARANPFYAEIGTRVHLGYFVPTAGRTEAGKLKRAVGKAGSWSVRKSMPDGNYKTESLDAVADDFQMANGKSVLTFNQAVKAASVQANLVGTEDISVETAAQEWAVMKNQTAKSAQARSGNDSAARRLAAAFPNRTIRNITVKEIADWRDSFAASVDPSEHQDEDALAEARRKRRATANRQLAELKAVLALATPDGYRGDKPWTKVKKFKSEDTHKARRIILSSEERQQLLAAITDPAFRDLILAAFHTGGRYGELCGMRIRDFDAARKTVELDGKTGHRFTTLSPDGVAFFSSICDRVNDPRRRLLLRSNGNPWGPDHQGAPMKAAVKAAGLDPETVLYSIRRTVISDWCAAGVPIDAVAKQAGTSTEMISTHYAKYLMGQKQAWFAAPSI